MSDTHGPTTEVIIIAGFGSVDPATLEAESRNIAARIISGDDPDGALDRILHTTQSVAYAQLVAKEAATLVAEMVLDESALVISTVPVPARRLSEFLHRSRMRIALFRVAHPHAGSEDV